MVTRNINIMVTVAIIISFADIIIIFKHKDLIFVMDTATQKTFDKIADVWHSLRKRPWMDVVEWARNIKEKVVLDLGSGTGRHSKPLAQENLVIALDFSKKMLDMNQYADYKIQGDISSIPLKDETVDVVLAIASIHHLKKGSRKKVLNEINKVLKPGGEGIVSVWYRHQERFKNIPTSGDVIIPWKFEGKSYPRYYHLFTLPELKKLIEDSNLKLESIHLDTMKRNIFAKIRKGK